MRSSASESARTPMTHQGQETSETKSIFIGLLIFRSTVFRRLCRWQNKREAISATCTLESGTSEFVLARPMRPITARDGTCAVWTASCGLTEGHLTVELNEHKYLVRGDPYGIRTRISAVKGPRPNP